jgi:TRAP-type C4-dicarboxylate transport system substrate-binding protein
MYGGEFMRGFKYILCLLLLAIILTGCSKTSKNVRTLTFGHGMNPNHPVAIAIEHFAKEVKKLSNGQLIIRIYPNELLGNETDLVQQVQLGCIDLVKTSASSLSSFIPDYSVLNMPYLFKNEIQYWNTLEGPIGQRILDSGIHYGLRGLTFYDAGARSFYTTKKLIRSPKDLKGMKIRVQPSYESIEMVKVLVSCHA